MQGVRVCACGYVCCKDRCTLKTRGFILLVVSCSWPCAPGPGRGEPTCAGALFPAVELPPAPRGRATTGGLRGLPC